MSVENGITIAIMLVVIYLLVVLGYQLIGRAIGGGGGSSSPASFSWSSNINLAT